MTHYIHEHRDWPHFKWDAGLADALSPLHHRLGHLLGQMGALGSPFRDEAQLRSLTLEITKNSEIEGEILANDQVRSSIARRLGLDVSDLVRPVRANRHVEGAVEILLDATQNFNQPLTEERLLDWHLSLFAASNRHLMIGRFRNDQEGPMQVVSGHYGRERIHFEAPAASRIPQEMAVFLAWFNAHLPLDPLLKAGIAHLWFVTLHPFDDGNGRLGRVITDMQLAKADGSPGRFYSMSMQIRAERKSYYEILEKTQKNALDITEWLAWFLACLERALMASENLLADVLKKARFWEMPETHSINERQRKMLEKLLDHFEGKLTTSKWAKISKCSEDTALRDIRDLVSRGILVKGPAGGRSTAWLLNI